MATVTWTEGFANLARWPGNLLNAYGGATIDTKTATTFTFTYPAGHEYEGYSVTIKGSGFVYDGSVPVSGTMSSITIKDDTGSTILTVSGLVAGSPESDLSLFYSNVFGWYDPNGNHNIPPPEVAWSQILTGNDTFTGTSGNDWQGFPGGNAGNDVFNMGAGDDWVQGSLGNDTINGGDGYDTLAFTETAWAQGIAIVRGANVNMVTGVILDPYGFKDKISGIEHVTGSTLADIFLGNDAGNSFEGLRGNDLIDGGGGDQDWADYYNDTWTGGSRGIVANLTSGTIKDGFGNTDTVINIENLTGSRYDDNFVGSASDNIFVGGNGKDKYDGMGGDDFIFFYNNFSDQAQHGINVDLSKASNQVIDDGFGNAETAISIEGINGTDFTDKIKGGTGANVFSGLDGKDTLTGGGGNDFFQWWDPNHMNDKDIIKDFTAGGGADQDVLVFYMTDFGASTTLTLVNGTAATQAKSTFIYDAAKDTLYWDPDGTGSAAKVAVALLEGVASLSAANFDLL